MPNVNDLMLIFSLAVLGILVLSALVGFLAGLKREIRLTVVFVVLLLLVWLGMGNVAGLLDTTLPNMATTMLQDMLGVSQNADSLRKVIIEFLQINVSGFADVLVEGTHTYSFLMSIIEFALRAVLLIVGTIVVYVLFLLIRLLSFIIGGIIRLCTIKRRRRKLDAKEAARETDIEDGVVVVKSDVYDGEVVVTVSRNPKKFYRGKRRGWAAGLGLLRGALVAILLCTPITGLLSIVEEVEPETVDMVLDIMGGDKNGNVAADTDSDLINWLFDLSEAYNDSAVGKTLSVPEYFLGKRLDDVFFDNVFKIETPTQTIYLREEIITLIQIANILPEAYDPTASIPIDIWALDDQKQDELFDLLKQVKVIYEIFPVAFEVAGELDMVKEILEPANQSLEGLVNIDWKVDWPLILDAVRAALELGPIDEIDPLALNSEVLREVLGTLGSTAFLRELMPVAINCALHMAVVENFVGPWTGGEISTENVSWRTELLNLVDIYDLFIELGLDFNDLDINELLANDSQTEIISTILTKLVTSNLFLDILVPIVDVAKEYQLGQLEFAEFAGLIKLTNLEGTDWDADMKNLVEMAKIVQEMGVLAGGEIALDNYDAFRGLINGFFDLMILSDKVNDSGIEVEGELVPLKTLLVEAAFRQFKLFDIEGKDAFKKFSDYDRSRIDWEHERTVFLGLVDEYESLVKFLESKGNTLQDFAGDIVKYLNYEETFEHVIDLLDTAVDSNLALAVMPLAVEKFAVPIIDSFEQGAGYDDIEEDDKISSDITEGITSQTIAAEIFNIVYMVMDAYEIGAFTMLGEEQELVLGATAYRPEQYVTPNSAAGEPQTNQLYEDFLAYGEVLGYLPAEDELALVDLIERLFHSTIFEGREGKVIRIILAVFMDIRVSKDAIYNINYSDIVENARSERDILVDAIRKLEPMLRDPEFILFNEDGTFNFDYILTTEHVTEILEALITLFDSKIIEVLLPEFYNQMAVEKGIIPAEWAEIFKVQSLWLQETQNTHFEGITGAELSQDIRTLLKMLLIVVDFNALNVLDEEKDVLFDGAKELFNEFFDLFLSLNILEDNGNELASLLVKQLLQIDIPVEDFEAMDVNWGEEVEGIQTIINALFDILANSQIDSYRELMEVVEDPVKYLEQVLVDDNINQISIIIQAISKSSVLETLGLPVLNKLVVPMISGFPELSEEEYSGTKLAEDIYALGQIIKDIADAQLMATVKAFLGEYTDLLPKTEDEVIIPLRHDLYADIIEQLFGLNILGVDSVKQFAIDTLAGMGLPVDLSTIDVTNLDFANDGKIIADAYRDFVEEFKQDIFPKLSFADILAVITGNKDVMEFVPALNKENLYALGHLASKILTTTLVEEFGLVAFNFGKTVLPENMAFLLDADLTKEEVVEDLKAVKEILQALVDVFGDSFNEIILNISNIMEDPMYIFELNSGIEVSELGETAATILGAIVDLNMFDGRGDEILAGALGLAGIEVDPSVLSEVSYKEEIELAIQILEKVEELLEANDITTLSSIKTNIIDKLGDILNSPELVNTNNVSTILEIVDLVLDSQLLSALIDPVFEKFSDDITGGMDGALKDLLTFDESYNGADLIKDLDTIVNALEKVVEFGIVDILVPREGKEFEFDLEKVDLLTSAIEELLSIKLLTQEGKLAEVIAYADEMLPDIDLGAIDVSKLDLAQDGKDLAAAINLIVDELLTPNQDGEVVIDLQALLDGEELDITTLDLQKVLSVVTDSLDLIFGTSLVQAGVYVVVDNYESIIPEDLQFIFETGLTAEELYQDLNTIIDILDLVLETEILKAVNGENFSFENLPSNVIEIVDKLLHMNIFTSDPAKLLQGVFALLGVEIAYEDLAQVDYSEDLETIYDAIRTVAAIVKNDIKVTDYESLKAAFNDLGQIINREVFSDENINDILDMIESLLKLQILQVVVDPVYEALVYPSFENTELAGLADLSEYPYSDIVVDLTSILDAIGQLVDGNLLGLLFENDKIDWNNTAPVENLIETIFSLKLLEVKLDDILDFVSSTGLDLSSIDASDINLAEDGRLIADAVAIIMTEVFGKGVIELETFMDVKDLSVKISNFLNRDTLLSILDAVEKVFETSLVGAGIAFAIDGYLYDMLPEQFAFIFETGITAELLQEDLISIVDILREVVYSGAYRFLLDEPVLIEGLSEHVINIVDEILHLNILAIDMPFIMHNVFKMVEIEVSEAVLATVDYEKDFAKIYEIIEIVLDEMIFENMGIETVNELIETEFTLELLATKANGHSAVEIVEVLVQLDLVEKVFPSVYEQMVEPMFEGLDESLKACTNLNDYPFNLLREDVLAILEVVHTAIDFNAIEVVLFEGSFDWSQYSPVEHLVEVLFASNYLEVKVDDIVDFISANIYDISDIKLGKLDLEADGLKVSAFIRSAIDAYLVSGIIEANTLEQIKGLTGISLETVLVKDALLEVLEGAKEVVETSIITVALQYAVEHQEDFVPAGLLFIFDTGLNEEHLQEDLVSIIDIVKEAVEAEAYNIVLEKDIYLEGIAEHINNILDIVFHLNIVSLDTPYLLYTFFNNERIYVTYEALQAVDYEGDFDNIYEIINIVEKVLVENLGLATVNDVLALEISMEDRTLLSNENVHAVLDIVAEVINLELLSVLYEPAYGRVKFGSAMDPFMGLLDISEYDASLLVEDLNNILSAVHELVDLNVLGFALFEEELDWANSSAVSNLVETIFGLNYVRVKTDDIISFVSENVYDISTVKASQLDLAADGLLIGEAIDILLETLIVSGRIEFNSMDDLEALTSIDIMALIEKEVLLNVLDAVQCIVDTTIAKAATGFVVEKHEDFVPADFLFVFDTGITGNELHEDICSIITIAREVVESDMYQIATGKDFSLVGISGHINRILDELLHLNILALDTAYMVQQGLRLVGIEVEYADLAAVDYEADYAKIYEIIEIVEEVLVENLGVTTYFGLLEIDLTIENEALISNENLHAVLDILSNVVNLELFSAVFTPAYNQMVSPMLGESLDASLLAFTDLYEYPVELLVEDLNNIIDALHQVVDFNALGIALRDEHINWSNTEPITNLIETIFGLNYLEVKLDDIIDYVSENIMSLEAISVEDIDLAADGKLIAEAVRILMADIMATGVIPVYKLSDINELVLYKEEVLTREVLHSALDAVQCVVDTTIVKAVVNFVVENQTEFVPADFGFIFETGITGEELHEDISTIITIAREAINSPFFNLVHDYDFSLVGTADVISSILDKVLHLNILAKDTAYLVQNALLLAGIEVSYDALNNVDFDADYNSIYNVLDIVEKVLTENIGVETYFGLTDLMESYDSIGSVMNDRNVVSNENLHEVLNILSEIVNLELVSAVFMPVYEQKVSPMFESMDESLKAFTDLSDYGTELVIEDLNSIIEILHNVVDFNTLGILLDNDLIDWNNTDPIVKSIETLFRLNVLEVKLDDILAYVTENVYDISVIEASQIDLAADGVLLAEAVRIIMSEILAKGIVDLERGTDFNNLSIKISNFLEKDTLLSVLDAVENVVKTTLVEAGLTVVVEKYDEFVPEQFIFLFETGITADLLQEDLISIVTILREVVDSEMYQILNEVDFSIVGISEHINTILDELLHLNIISIDTAHIIQNALAMAGIEVSYDELATVDYESDYAKIYEIISNVEKALVENAGITTYYGLLDIDLSIENRALVSNENLHVVLDILSNVVNLELFSVVFTPAYEQKVYPMLGDSLEAFTNLSEYPVELLVEDLNNIIEALHPVVDFNVLGIVLHDEYINWSNTEPITNLIETIFALNYLEVKFDNIFNYVADNIVDIYMVDQDSIDLVGDGKLIAEAVRILMADIMATGVIPVYKLSDINDLVLYKEEVLTRKVLHSALDAVQCIVDTTIVKAVADFVVEKHADFVPADFLFIFDTGITGEELYEDLSSVVTILRAVVDSELYNLLFEEDFPLTGISTQINTILDKVLHLNILTKDMAYVVQNALLLAGIEVSYDALSVVDFDADYAKIYEIIEIVEYILVNNLETETYFELKDFVKELGATSDLIYNKKVVSNANLHQVLFILSNVVNLDLFSATFDAVYEQVVSPMFESLQPEYLALTDLSNYPVELLVEDLNNIIESLHGVIDFNLLGIIRDNEIIDWANKAAIQNVITTIFSSSYVEVKNDAIVDLIVSMVDLLADYEVVIDFENDGQVIAEIYGYVADIMNECVKVNTISGIQEIDKVSQYINDTCAEYIVKILRETAKLSFLPLAFEIAFDKLAEVLPEDLAFLANPGTAGIEGIVEDYSSIIDIIEILVDAKFAGALFLNENINVMLEDEAMEIIDIFFGLNYIDLNNGSNKLERLLEYGINQIDNEYVEYFDADIIDWDYEVNTTIKNIVSELFDLIAINTNGTFDGCENYIATLTADGNLDLRVFLTIANANILLNIVEHVLDSTIIDATAEVIYEVLIDMLQQTDFGFLLEDITPSMLLEDVSTVLVSVRNMVNDNMIPMVFDILKDVDNTDLIPIIRSALDEIPNILSIQVLSIHKNDLVKYLVDRLGLDDTYLDYEAIIWDEETQIIAEVLHIVADMLEESNVRTIQSLLSIIEAGEFLSDVRIINNPNITSFVGILEVLTDSNLIAELAIPAYIKYVNPIIEGIDKEALRELLTINYTNYSSTMFQEDFVEIVELLVLLDNDELLIKVIDLVNLIDTEVVYANAFENIARQMYELHLIKDRTELIHKVICEFAGIEYEDIESEIIDTDADLEVVVELIHMVCDLLRSEGLIMIGDITNAMKNLSDYLNNENAIKVLDIADKALELTTVKAMMISLLDAYVADKLPETLAGIYHNENYSLDNLYTDLHSLISIARSAVEFDVINIRLHGAEIDWSNTVPVEAIIKEVCELLIINNNLGLIVDYINESSLPIELVQVDEANIDLAADGELFAAAYAIIAKAIFTQDAFPVHYYKDLTSPDFARHALLTEENINTIIEAMHIVVDTTVVYEISLDVLRTINTELVPASAMFIIQDANLSKAEAVEDFHTLLDIAGIAVDFGAIDYYNAGVLYLIQPELIKNLIEKVYDLHVLEDSEIRINSINAVLGKLGIAELESVSDWDNEEAVMISLVDDVCNFLEDNNIAYLSDLLDFVKSGSYKDEEFLTKENLYAILDILEKASDSEVIAHVLADLYNSKAVPQVGYEAVIELLEFGTDARDYNKDLFVEDIKPIIQLARKAVELGIIELYFDRDADIPTASVINEVLEQVFALNLFDGRLDLFAGVVFGKLGVDVDLTGIDWDNEVEVLYNVVDLVIPAVHNSGILRLSDALDVLRLAKSDIVSFVKDNRTYANLTNAYVGIDVLEELSNSEVYMRSLLKLYSRAQGLLPEVITSNIDINLYLEEEMRADYPIVIGIMRNVLDSGIYHVLVERRGYAFPESAVEPIEEIVAAVCDLHFTAHYADDMIRIVADFLGIDVSDAKLENISLAQDKEELVSMVAPLRNIWLASNGLRVNIPLFANKELFENISVILKAFGTTTLHEVLTPFVYNAYISDMIYTVADSTGIEALYDLAVYTDEQVYDAYRDLVFVFNEMIAMNVFGTSGIDFTDVSHLTNIYNIMLKHVALGDNITKHLDIMVANSYLMGVIYVPYAEVASTRAELSTMKQIAVAALDILTTYLGEVSTSDLSVLANDQFEQDVMDLLDLIEDSVLLSETFIPLINGLVDARLGADYAEYDAIPVATYAEFKDAVSQVFDIVDKADEVGILSMNIKYKDTVGIAELFHLIENCPFTAGQETILVKIMLRVTKILDPETIDLSHIVWADEYQYMYAFLAKANAPLNMDGVNISSDIKASLSDPDFVRPMTDALKELAASHVLVAFYEEVLQQIVADKYPSITDYLNYDHLDSLGYDEYAEAIQGEFVKALDAMALASEVGLLAEDSSVVNVDTLLALYDNIFALEGTRHTKPEIFNKLVDVLPAIGGKTIIPDDIDWDAEVIAVRGIIEALRGFADVDGNINKDQVNDIATSSTDVAALEQLFTALNRSQIYRPSFYNLINDHIDEFGTGDLAMPQFLTEWFKDQETGMRPIAEWESEVILLARLVAIANNLKANNADFANIKDIELGVVDSTNAAEIATEDFHVADYGLRQLLQIIGASKSFTLTALNNVFENVLIDRTADGSGSGIIKTDKHLPELTEEQWIAEIDDIIVLLQDVQTLGLLDSSDAMASQLTKLNAEEVAKLIKSFNHCEPLRYLLPDMIADALVEANAGDYRAEWLTAQCGTTAGVNNPMATEEEWDAEADKLAEIITHSEDFDFNNLVLNHLTNEQLDTLEDLLLAINACQSLVLDPMVDTINKLLEAQGYETKVLGVFDGPDAGSSNTEEWADEIPTLISIVKQINNGLGISSDIVKNNPENLGVLLNTMKESRLFGNDVKHDGTTTVTDNVYNTLVCEILETTKLIKDPANPNGFIDKAQAYSTDWTIYNWETELAIIKSFDTAAGTQSDDTIKVLASSQIIKDFFDIASIINDKIDGVSMTIDIVVLGVPYQATLSLGAYVPGYPFTNDELRGLDWAQEIDDMNAIVAIFDAGYRTGFRADLENLIATGHDTIAVNTAAVLKAKFVADGVWSYLA